MKNCGDKNQIITSLNNSVFINGKCEMIPNSCSLIKPYNKFIVNVQVIETQTSIMFSNLTYDVCSDKTKSAKSENFKILMIEFGFPIQCPVKQQFIQCYNESNKVRFSQSYQKIIPLFGTSPGVTMKIKAIHDTGTSCITFHGKFSKLST